MEFGKILAFLPFFFMCLDKIKGIEVARRQISGKFLSKLVAVLAVSVCVDLGTCRREDGILILPGLQLVKSLFVPCFLVDFIIFFSPFAVTVLTKFLDLFVSFVGLFWQLINFISSSGLLMLKWTLCLKVESKKSQRRALQRHTIVKNIRKKLEKNLEDKSPCCFWENAKNKIGSFVEVLSQCIRFLRLFGGKTSEYQEKEAKIIFESDGMEFDMDDYLRLKNANENKFGYPSS